MQKTKDRSQERYKVNRISRKRWNFIYAFYTGIIKFFFRKIGFDDESLGTLRNYEGKGKIVYATLQSSSASLLILLNALEKKGLSKPSTIFGFSYFVFFNLKSIYYIVLSSLKSFFSKSSELAVSDKELFTTMIKEEKTIAFSLLSGRLFRRRYLEIRADLIQHFIEVQKQTDEPVLVFPFIMFWNRNPERTKALVTSKATMDRGLLSAVFTTLKSATPAFMRISNPINLQDVLKEYEGEDSSVIAVKVRKKLIEDFSHQERTVLGPVIKSQQEMMEKVLYHKNVMDSIHNEILETGQSEKKLRRDAYNYYKEIAADFSIIYIRFFEKSVDYIFGKIFQGIYYSLEDFKMLREASQKGPLIIMPSHKSHMDYLIISSIFYQNKLIPPHILSGSNLTFFPMGKIFRRSGAFFMRRSFKGLTIYATVFRQYIRTLINEGYSVEFFVEGGRSRTGKLLQPKMGILKYLIDAIEDGYNDDMMFVPATINYNRILEESSYSKELAGDEKVAESTGTFVKSRKLLKRKYGSVYLSFGQPVSYKELSKKIGDTDNLPNSIANYILKEINSITVVTQFSIVSMAILHIQTRGFSQEILKNEVSRMLDYLIYCDIDIADAVLSDDSIDESLDYVLNSYMQDGIVNEFSVDKKAKVASREEYLYALEPNYRTAISFYKNNIIHYFLPLSFTSVSVLIFCENGEVSRTKLYDGFKYLMELFSKEFVFTKFMDNIRNAVDRTVEYLDQKMILSASKSKVRVEADSINDLMFFARLIQEYFESYLVVFKTIQKLGRVKINKKELKAEVRKNGIRMYHFEEISLTEAMSDIAYENAIKKLEDIEIIHVSELNKRESEAEIIDLHRAEQIAERLEQYLSSVKNQAVNLNRLGQYRE